VRDEFAKAPNLAELNVETLVQRWRISARSLRRHLALENASFLALLDEARLARARDLLSRHELSLEQISKRLGYADRNSFNRAFKRWMGTPPASYRRLAQAHAQLGDIQTRNRCASSC
jgi:AraC-like DNA-binding protein